MNYDTFQFLENIESVQGILFLRENDIEGVSGRFYQGVNGKLVLIDTSEEEITSHTGKGYLIQLGVEYLISAFFPEEKEFVLTKENIDNIKVKKEDEA